MVSTTHIATDFKCWHCIVCCVWSSNDIIMFCITAIWFTCVLPGLTSPSHRTQCFSLSLFRLRLASFDNSGKLVCSRSTGYQLLTLEKDQVSPGPQYPVWSMKSQALPVGYCTSSAGWHRCIATQRCQKPWSALESFWKLRSSELSFWALKLVYYDQVRFSLWIILKFAANRDI